jgi:glycosyltransferase involved in cell wall biosynthesis
MSRLYDIPHSSFRVLSNISFFQEAKKLYFDKENILLDRPIRLGHMANLSIEKGLDIFVEICRKLLELDVNFSAIIAGPYASSNSKMLIEDICASTNKVKYIGPVYGTDKEYFFSNIDIFIFPSKYKNEAEPLVIYEAAQYGNLVIGSKQGSIEYMVEKIGGIAFDISNNNNESFLKATVTRIVQLISSKDVIGNKIKIIDKYNEFVRINKKSLLLLLNEFKE